MKGTLYAGPRVSFPSPGPWGQGLALPLLFAGWARYIYKSPQRLSAMEVVMPVFQVGRQVQRG